MSDPNPAHGGPAERAEIAERSEQAGIADESAAFATAIDHAPASDSEGPDRTSDLADNPVVGAGTAGDPGIADRTGSTSIDLSDEGAAQRWADRYSVTRAQLEEAVSAVGEDAHAVQTYLRGQGGGD